jgi:hypothetical protein
MSWFTSMWIVGGFFGFVAIVIGILFVIIVLSERLFIALSKVSVPRWASGQFAVSIGAAPSECFKARRAGICIGTDRKPSVTEVAFGRDRATG